MSRRADVMLSPLNTVNHDQPYIQVLSLNSSSINDDPHILLQPSNIIAAGVFYKRRRRYENQHVHKSS